MKNLKKILVALVLVALLISSVVTIAIAEASYTGTVEGAKQLLQTAIEATPSAGQSYADVRTSSLGKLHTYLLTVDPKEEPKDQGGEKAVFVQIKADTARKGRVAQQRCAEQRTLPSRKTVPCAQHP